MNEFDLQTSEASFAFKCVPGSLAEQVQSLVLADTPIPEFCCFLSTLQKIFAVIQRDLCVLDLCSAINSLKAYLIELEESVITEMQLSIDKKAININFKEWLKPNEDLLQLTSQFIEVHPIVEKLLRRPEHIEAPQLSNVQLGQVKELNILCEAVTVKIQSVQKSKYFFASQVIPYLEMLSQDLENLKLFSRQVIKVRDCVQEKVKSTLTFFMRSQLHCQATALDPRYKTVIFENEPLVYANTLKNLKSKLKRLVEESSVELQDVRPESAAPPEQQENSIRTHDFGNYVSGKGRRVNSLSKWEVADIQLQTFYKDSSIVKGEFCDVIKFWEDRLPAEPYLSQLALLKVPICVKSSHCLSSVVHSKNIGVESCHAIFLSSVADMDWCS